LISKSLVRVFDSYQILIFCQLSFSIKFVLRIPITDIPNRVANAAPLPRAKIEELRLTMDAALHADATAAESSLKNSKRHASADDKFLATVLQSGTVSDKVAAMTLVVQQAPHERINVLDRYFTLIFLFHCIRSKFSCSSLTSFLIFLCVLFCFEKCLIMFLFCTV
jgi:hypothetical protein